MVKQMVNGVEREFADEQAAAAAVADAAAAAANAAAARKLLACGTGGAKYKSEAFALKLTRFILADRLVNVTDADGKKLKGKEVTGDVIGREIIGLDEADFVDAARDAFRDVVSNVVTLLNARQVPMKGGRLPRDVAADAIVMIRPESAAAAIGSATARIQDALP